MRLIGIRVPPKSVYSNSETAVTRTMYSSGIVFTVTGIFLWFLEVLGCTPAWISQFFHDIAALIMLGGFFIHVYEGTIGAPGSLRAMIRGTVTEAWAGPITQPGTA